MTVTVRFAPSPTGNIHIGNARTALMNWLFARQRGGRFLLRYDDTDAARSKREFADQIAADLAWLGIAPDAVYRQSERLALYETAAQGLRRSGHLYPCYETAGELELRRKRQASLGKPPLYDRAALRLTQGERVELEGKGRKPHWRFRLPNFDRDPLTPRRTEIGWNDLIRGPQAVDLASLSDPVLVREDGMATYTLSSVVDDIDLQVTHVIRGEDHVANTGVQIAIFSALGAVAPAFAHHNLLTNASGEGLSKRLGSLSLKSLAADGYEPMAVASLAVLTGGAGIVEPLADMDALAARFDLAGVSTSAAKFDVAELDRLNARLVHRMEWREAAPRFAPDAFGGRGAEFWPAVRENLSRAGGALELWDRFMAAPAAADPANRDYLRQARALLPAGDVGAETWGRWTADLGRATGRKGRDLYLPLRKALTGMDHGPDMARLLPLIGRERILARLP
jgi:glutamyl-tRNA synthetase